MGAGNLVHVHMILLCSKRTTMTKLHSKLVSAGMAMALGFTATAAQAAITVVKVEDIAATNGQIIQSIAPGFGSTPTVSLNWNPLNDPSTALRFWDSNYSGRAAAYCNAGVSCTLDLLAVGSSQVKLWGFRFGGWPNFTRSIDFKVVDLATNTPISAGTANADAFLGDAYVIGFTSGTGFRITFGPDGFNGGINDIKFEGIAAAGVPEASTWLMLIAGFGAVGAAMRRRKSASAIQAS